MSFSILHSRAYRYAIVVLVTVVVAIGFLFVQAASGATTPSITFTQTSVSIGTGGSTVVGVEVAGAPVGTDAIQVNAPERGAGGPFLFGK